MAIRICIYCDKEKESKQFLNRWSPDLGACSGCVCKQFRDYEAKRMDENK
ncbi:MAG: hypothetical protein GBAus27B_000515 [Mycoplasmataceae bacterium]|nr:MAG: hypothetical protein GBAus27B_000515 [Mycoplasmataceae bacterium]